MDAGLHIGARCLKGCFTGHIADTLAVYLDPQHKGLGKRCVQVDGQRCAGQHRQQIICQLPRGAERRLEICRRLREVKDTPVIIISALADDIDKVRGLGLGADDYMTKPFSPSELVARVKGHIQRYERLVGSREQRRPEVLKIRGLEIDRDSRRVWVNGKETSMTGKEYDLLLFLAEHPDTVFSKDRLFDSVWGVEAIGDVSTVTVHIKHIRDKIELNPDRTQYIETVWGVGYRFRG